MKFLIHRTNSMNPQIPKAVKVIDGDRDAIWTIEIDTLEQLIALAVEVGDELIVTPGLPSSIEIYDGYRE